MRAALRVLANVASRRTREGDMAMSSRAVRDRDHRRRPGRAGDGLPAAPARHARSSSSTPHERVGDAWRTPLGLAAAVHARPAYDGLPGHAVPRRRPGRSRPRTRWPTTSRRYAGTGSSCRCAPASRCGGSRTTASGYRASTRGDQRYRGATTSSSRPATTGTPTVPGFAAELDPQSCSCTPSDYRNPAQLRRRRRAARRRRQLRRRHRARAGAGTHRRAAVRPAPRPDPVATSTAGRTARLFLAGDVRFLHAC